MAIVNGVNVPNGNAGALPNEQTQPFTPLQVVPFIGQGLGQGTGNVVKSTGQGDEITRIITGITDSLTNIGEHLLIYTIFAAIFIMLLWVIVSDQTPIEIVNSTVKSASKIGETAALA